MAIEFVSVDRMRSPISGTRLMILCAIVTLVRSATHITKPNYNDWCGRSDAVANGSIQLLDVLRGGG